MSQFGLPLDCVAKLIINLIEYQYQLLVGASKIAFGALINSKLGIIGIGHKSTWSVLRVK